MEKHIKELRKIIEKYSNEIFEIRLCDIDTDKDYLQRTYIKDKTFFVLRYKENLYSICADIDLVAPSKIEYKLFKEVIEKT
jgi:hypothetical protein